MIDEKHKEEEERYLWDRTGPVDPVVERLESALGCLKHTAPAPRPSQRPPAIVAWRATHLRAAAGFMLAIGGVWLAAMLLHNPHKRLRPSGSPIAWEVTALQGTARIGAETIGGTGELRIGQWLETNHAAQVKLSVPSIGAVTVEPESRLRLVESRQDEHRLELARGRIEAFITAPPRLFFVDTPAATAVDLGCKYILDVDSAGSGQLEVTLGWVSLETTSQVAESTVPAGAICKTRVGHEPGTPYFSDASPRLIRELARFDFNGGGAESLRAVLAEARPRDSLTLWHLLSRATGEDRGEVYARLADFFNPPQGVDRQAIMRGDRVALRAWRDSFIWSPLRPTSRMPRFKG